MQKDTAISYSLELEYFIQLVSSISSHANKLNAKRKGEEIFKAVIDSN